VTVQLSLGAAFKTVVAAYALVAMVVANAQPAKNFFISISSASPQVQPGDPAVCSCP
jgi:hypothetical protein